MSVAASITAMQTRHAAISGVVSAPTAYPTGLNAAALPLILTDAGKARTEWETQGGDFALEVRAYRVRCFCLAAGLGVGIDQGKQQAITILDAVLASYRSAPTLTSTAAVRIEAGLEDSGIIMLRYTDPDTTYWGFELAVSVEERWE